MTLPASSNRKTRRVLDRDLQEAEAYRFWRAQTTADWMMAIDQIIREGYAAKGIDIDVQGSDRSIVRLHRPPSTQIKLSIL